MPPHPPVRRGGELGQDGGESAPAGDLGVGTAPPSPGSAAPGRGPNTALLAAIAAIADRDDAGATRLVRAHAEHTRQSHHARNRG